MRGKWLIDSITVSAGGSNKIHVGRRRASDHWTTVRRIYTLSACRVRESQTEVPYRTASVLRRRTQHTRLGRLIKNWFQ